MDERGSSSRIAVTEPVSGSGQTDVATIPPASIRARPVRRDAVDVRDLLYRPTLRILPQQFLSAALRPREAVSGCLTIRDQQGRPTCVGHALAALIDIQRLETLQAGTDPSSIENVCPASADMLYLAALTVQAEEDAGRADMAAPRHGDVFSLRAGLKGFFNSGVATEATWTARGPGIGTTSIDDLAPDVMVEARNVTLGAYYRVRPVINDYHAALVEAGALYVSAQLHRGWDAPVDGVIRIDRTVDANGPEPGGHAFVIVGFEQRGFLVLNSWGGDWGGYALADGTRLEGVALWTYEDWASSVFDAWVLRLAVPTPDAFQFTIGEHGLASFVESGEFPPPVRKPRRLAVLGHYLHLDDGRLVGSGSYPSTEIGFRGTLAELSASPATDVLVVLHGDVSETGDVLLRTAQRIEEDRRAAIHRLSIVWANDLLSGAATALSPLFTQAWEQVGGSGWDCDVLIERLTRPVGRALWRDVHASARRAAGLEEAPDVRPKAQRIANVGDAIEALASGLGPGRRLHVLTEGVGILLLAALCERWRRRGAPDRPVLSDVPIRTLHVVAPLIGRRDFLDTVGAAVAEPGSAVERSFVYLPDRPMEARLRVGPYSKSWTQLVARSFHPEVPKANRLMIAPPAGPRTGERRPEVVLLRVAADVASLGFEDVLRHPSIEQSLAAAIDRTRRSRPTTGTADTFVPQP